MADLAKLVDDLSSLTVLEAADLAKMLEEKWGVSAAAAVAVAAGPAGGAAAAPRLAAARGAAPRGPAAAVDLGEVVVVGGSSVGHEFAP